MIDRRVHPRFPLILSVGYGEADELRDSTENLSADGLFIRTERDFELGERLPLVLSFPELLEPVELEVEVTWKAPGDAAGEGGGVGVRVPRDNAEHRARLADLARRAAEAANGPPIAFRVLLVEDSGLVASMYSAALRKLAATDHAGFGIDTAPDGAAALERLRRAPAVDLVVTDVHMPVLSGVELVRTMRADPALANTPVIAISSRPEDAREELERLGVRLFLRKPIKYEELVRTVRALLRVRPIAGGAATSGRSPAGPDRDP
ncbi:MAG TPA: response regulator [Anaeromyxobacteraceae bacterium]|nr:response regulator [Anaeromyxobacteraceae bacterium]